MEGMGQWNWGCGRWHLCFVLTAGLTLMLAGCAAEERTTAGTATPLTGVSIESLVRPPGDEPFEVTVGYTEGVPGGGPGIFVWRQGGGRRRWDVEAEAGYKQGWFMSTDGFAAGLGSRPAAGRDCTWDGYRNDSSVQAPFVQCGGEKTGIGLLGAVSSTLAGRVSHRLADRVIGDVPAQCYSIARRSGKSDATLCVDPARRIPLAVEGSYGAETHVVEAVEVAAAPAPLSAAINDLSVAAPNDTTVLLTTLDLPRAITDSLQP